MKLLATLAHSELIKQLQLVRTKLEQLQAQDNEASSLQRQWQNADKQVMAQQRQTLHQSLQAIQKLTPILKEKGLDSIGRDRALITFFFPLLKSWSGIN
ncbi:MAG: hypothetical protein V7K64_04735 [Nostoc sp.]|uniref:hypothetical protein n=1 Tax=unclassified Nostoc TaxID=2593658 RepID=UPI001DF4CCAF|nr:hypothetical protein [Nostoc sp. JL34]MBN3887238.1 hypothetical protein [Nostoc sp. JL34]